MNLSVRNCALCQKMFKYKGNPVCPACVEQTDKDYITLRDYLYEHPASGVRELAEGTEISEKTILHLVRVGRITFAEGTDTGIRCSSCGKFINKGQLCDSCAKKLSQTLASAVPQKDATQDAKPTSSKTRGVRMHISDRLEGN